MRQVRRAAQSAAQVDPESSLQFTVNYASDRPKTYIVNAQTGVIFGAPFKGDFKLPPQILTVFIAHQVAEQGLDVGRNIEGFGVRDAGAITGCDIAHSVAA